MIVQCPNCPATMELDTNNADLGDRSYKLLCPALRENLAAKVLRANLAAQKRADIDQIVPTCGTQERLCLRGGEMQ